MSRIENNIKRSFRGVKNDILELKNQILMLAEGQEKLGVLFSERKEKKVKTVKSKTKSFVAAKEGKKFHIRECPYAKNIKPKSRINFKTKSTALNKGYKPCSCV
tara:strand:+ start:180 stop:491 length:312 start_codon:yes stop_codon:yes gene_type:complete